MVTGIECAGLVLAVLPIFVEATKAYRRGANTIYNVASRTRLDKALEEFYEEFVWAIVMLHRQIKSMIDALPYLSSDRKTYLAEHLEEWKQDTDVAQALQEFFNSKMDFDIFMVIVTKIVQLLSQLIQDPSVHISVQDMNQSVMYNKLKDFRTEYKKSQSSSSLQERIRFWRKKKDRDKCLEAFHKWNTRLGQLMDDAHKEPIASNTPASTKKAPSYSLRGVSQTVFSALSKCWSCECDIPHEAKVCLKANGDYSGDFHEADIRFDFLFSATIETGRWTWQEGLVLVRSREDMEKDSCAALRRLCDAINASGGNNHCLQLLINNLDRDKTVWQLRSQPRQTKFVETMPSVSLQTLLQGHTRLPLKVKRRLALLLAKSLLHFHEDFWRGRDWNKEQISFFYESIDKPDYLRPYISASFQHSGSDFVVANLNVFHRNLGILALGILLIEIHTEKPIEHYRTAKDLINGQDANVNTDFTVADRVAKSLDDCSYNYKKAIQSCLDTPWAAAGQRVSLDDPEIVSGIYEDVIQPLEEEITYLFRETV